MRQSFYITKSNMEQCVCVWGGGGGGELGGARVTPQRQPFAFCGHEAG